MTRLVINHRERYKVAFTEVIDNYVETKVSHGTNPSRDYEAFAFRDPGATSPKKLVRPTTSDFICDVEIAARRALAENHELHEIFVSVFVNQSRSMDTVKDGDRELMEQQVGRMFTNRRIHPLALYFKAKDLR